MDKHLLVASDLNHTPARYSVGYEDAGDITLTIGDVDFCKGKWFDAEDTEIEVVLLSLLCPNYLVKAQQVNGDILGKRGR
ncbi:hypothetical protein [Dankookia rubra]|uniref:hypothetical protein n=1 Tax=Dankookia rubra TaxID=1442381 RepID=UPI00140773F3|nr:hypothetical protein [Dankookia rubra]